MSFIVKLFSQLFEKAAVEKLATSTAMKTFAQKIVELERAGQTAIKKPEEAKAAAKEHVQSFFDHFSAEVAKDLGFANDDKAGKKMLENKSTSTTQKLS